MVSTIAIATIAATICRDGLGCPIFYAIELPTPFKTEIYSAGALAVALALACDAGLVAASAGGHALGEDGADDPTSPSTFIQALQFIADNPELLLQKAFEQLELSGAALGGRAA